VACGLNRGTESSGPWVTAKSDLQNGELKSDSDMCTSLKIRLFAGIGSFKSRAAVLASGDRRKVGRDVPLDLVQDAAQVSNVCISALVVGALSKLPVRKAVESVGERQKPYL
jgi:hypothetical protein